MPLFMDIHRNVEGLTGQKVTGGLHITGRWLQPGENRRRAWV